MAAEIRVPSTGNAGEDAVVLEWRVALGDTVAVGDVVVVLETAKASVEVEATVAGTVLALLAKVDDEVPEHAVLLVIGDPTEAVSVPEATAPAQVSSKLSEPTPATLSEPVSATVAAAPNAVANSGAPKTSPRARILADRNGIELSELRGSGPGGRIIAADVLAAKAQPRSSEPSPGSSEPLPSAIGAGLPAFTLHPVRGARKITAQRMHRSLQESAQVTLTRYAGADTLVSFNGRLRAHTERHALPRVSVNDLVNFAVSRALLQHPDANSTFSWDGIRQFHQVNLGIAVDTGSALLVPVVPRADSLSLSQLANASRQLIERARSGAISSEEMEHGTFTVSNLGAMGVHWFTPVINPPQSCILGVGAIYRAVPGAPAQLPLSLSFDHRALDGARAAAALTAIAEAIEHIDVLAATTATDSI